MLRRIVGLGLLAAVMFLGAGSAEAQTDPYVTPPPEVPFGELPPLVPPQVAPLVLTQPGPDPEVPAVAPEQVAQPEVRGVEVRALPVTGGDLLGLLAIGAVLVAFGTAAVVSTRRRRAAELA